MPNSMIALFIPLYLGILVLIIERLISKKPRKEISEDVPMGDNYVIIWNGGYETKDFAKRSGFEWDPVGKRWWTNDLKVVHKIPKKFEMLWHYEKIGES